MSEFLAEADALVIIFGSGLDGTLDEIARKGGFQPEQPYYICGDVRAEDDEECIYSDEGILWCHQCAEATLIMAKARDDKFDASRHPIYEASIDGGEDNISSCHYCAKILDCRLNDTGVASEIDAHQKWPTTFLTPESAWEIARLVEAAPDNEEVTAIAIAALKLPRLP